MPQRIFFKEIARLIHQRSPRNDAGRQQVTLIENFALVLHATRTDSSRASSAAIVARG